MPAKKKNPNKPAGKRVLIAGLVVNLILPGLGTIIRGKYDKGTLQIILALAGLLFSITFAGVIIGMPLFAAMWLWALFDGIKSLKK